MYDFYNSLVDQKKINSKNETEFFETRSLRWTSGSPRMLLVVLDREFESRRGEILKLFAEMKKQKDQLLRAPSVGKHNSTRVDEGRAEIFSR